MGITRHYGFGFDLFVVEIVEKELTVVINILAWILLWIFTGGALYNTVGTQDWLAVTVGVLGMPVIIFLVLFISLRENNK